MNGRVPSLSGCRQQRAGEGDRRSAPPLDQRPSGGNHDAQDAKVEQQMNGTEMDDHLRERRRLDARAYQPVPYAVEGEPQGLERQRGPDPPTRGSYALHDVFPRSACHARSAQPTVRAHIHSGATRVSVCGLFGPFLSTPQSAKRSEEHTSELQSRLHLVCRLLLEKKKKHTTHVVLLAAHITKR